MNSIEKLKRLTGEKTKASEKPSSKQFQIDELRRRIDTIMSRRPNRQQSASEKKFEVEEINLAEIVPGEETENDYGRFFLASEVIRGSSRHGHRNIRETFGLDMKAAHYWRTIRVLPIVTRPMLCFWIRRRQGLPEAREQWLS